MNDIYKVLKYIKEYIEDPKVIKDPMLQKIYVGAAAKANKLSKKHGTHYVLYDPSIAKLAVVAKSNLKQEVKENGLTKDTSVLYVAKGKKVSEVAPPGWEGTVKAMKKSGEIDNPWALAWWMKNKGHKSHKEVKEWHTGKRKDRVKQAKNQSEVLGYKMVGEVEEPSWDLTKKADRGDNIGEAASSKVKNKIKSIMKYHPIADLADYIEQFNIDKKHWKYVGELFNRIRDEVQGRKPKGYADRYRKELEKVLFKVIKEAKKRDYKAEYKKFQSSKKSKKYRAELNAYNRKKGTYGNGDGKDASHKGGKIVGFEKESKNRGRREKSRLKKEGRISEISSTDAKTLLKQLGGNKFLAMTGAKDFGIGSDGLHFKIGRNSKSISHVVIDYKRGKDLYEMKFLRVRAGKIKVIKKVDNVYFDQLGKIFTRYTGLYIRL